MPTQSHEASAAAGGGPKARRRRGTGSVTQVRPGVFKLRVFVGTDLLTGHPVQRQKTVHVRTVSEAQRELVRFQGEVSTEFGLANADAPKTLNDLLTRFAAHQESQGRALRTIAATESTRDTVVGPYLGDVALSDLTPQHLNALYDRLRRGDELHAPQSPASLERFHAVVHAALGYAVDCGWVAVNVADRAKGRPAVVKKKLRPPSHDDVHRYLVAALEKNVRYGVLTLFAVLTGTRRGEFCALRWSDVNRDGGVLVVERALYRAGSRRGEKDAKDHLQREVPITPELDAVLTAWRTRCEQTAREAGVELAGDGFVVASLPDGSAPVNPDSVSTFQGRLARQLGIELQGRNPFRHWGGSAALSGGASARDAADLLGHADVKTFLQHYAHSQLDGRRRAAAILGSVLGDMVVVSAALAGDPAPDPPAE